MSHVHCLFQGFCFESFGQSSVSNILPEASFSGFSTLRWHQVSHCSTVLFKPSMCKLPMDIACADSCASRRFAPTGPTSSRQKRRDRKQCAMLIQLTNAKQTADNV